MAARGGCRRRAVDGAVEREPPGEPVFTDGQQIGQIADLTGALQPQRQTALRRHRDRQSGGQYKRRRAAQFELVPFDAADLAVQRKLASIPGAVDIETKRRQPLLLW